MRPLLNVRTAGEQHLSDRCAFIFLFHRVTRWNRNMNAHRSLRCCSPAVRTLSNGRMGLSVLEFVGCLIALVGGVWLGAIYLGIDVHRVAYVALSESELMEKVPEDL